MILIIEKTSNLNCDVSFVQDMQLKVLHIKDIMGIYIKKQEKNKNRKLQ